MNTDDLLKSLAQDLTPAPPLARPIARAGTWFVGAALYVALLVIGMRFVAGYPGGPSAVFWVAQFAALATSLLASAAAFASVVPGFAGRSRGLAILAASAWLATLVVASIADGDWSALSATHEGWCVAFIVLGGTPLLVVLAWMLRRGAPLEPATTAALAALSVAALANVGACVSLPHANNAVTLAWHGGVIVACTALGAAGGRRLFSWRAKRPSTSALGRGADMPYLHTLEFHEVLVRGRSPVTALFNLMNGLGVELERSYVTPASKRLAERGYLPLLGMMKR